MKKISSITDFPLVSNVCDQLLREVFGTHTFSLAYVTMLKGAESLLHKHNKMAEVYFILSGHGQLIHGDTQSEVKAGSCILIDCAIPHMLKNIGSDELTHFVIAIPPFDPQDVELVTDSAQPTNFKSFSLPQTFIGRDEGHVYEFKDISWQNLGMSLAYGYLEPHQRARAHFHNQTDEWYFIKDGIGKAHLDDEEFDIKAGDLITVLKGTRHALENVSDSRLHVVCICNPQFTEEDFHYAH